MGRPKILGENPKDVKVYLSDDDHRRVRMLAAQSGRSMGAYLREIVKAHLDDTEYNEDDPRHWTTAQILDHRDNVHGGTFLPEVCDECRVLNTG
jgi:plasmid stability protein